MTSDVYSRSWTLRQYDNRTMILRKGALPGVATCGSRSEKGGVSQTIGYSRLIRRVVPLSAKLIRCTIREKDENKVYFVNRDHGKEYPTFSGVTDYGQG